MSSPEAADVSDVAELADVAEADAAEGADAAEVGEVADARSAALVGVWASGARCTLQYVIAPALGAGGFWLPWLGLLFQIVGCAITVAATLRLGALASPRWPAYAAVSVAVVASTLLAVAGWYA